MASLFTLAKGLPVLAAYVAAGASYPAIPSDETTPVQQRLAINGPTCAYSGASCYCLDLSC